jgi:transcriptional regulator with AAA-type ATPase domain
MESETNKTNTEMTEEAKFCHQLLVDLPPIRESVKMEIVDLPNSYLNQQSPRDELLVKSSSHEDTSLESL